MNTEDLGGYPNWATRETALEWDNTESMYLYRREMARRCLDVQDLAKRLIDAPGLITGRSRNEAIRLLTTKLRNMGGRRGTRWNHLAADWIDELLEENAT